MEVWQAPACEAVAAVDDLPYLSVVVTARNDDHGGNLLGRMQAFVNALIGQARRHGLAMELVLVEWNPPAERPPLGEALHWPQDFGPCRVRIIEVPPEVHRRYQCAEALALYQMIAKNVGIRRARGRFILATNIDILLSDELCEFLARRRLESGKMYRIDRHDVMTDVPAGAPVDQQLAYCRSHLLRLNAREGTFKLTPEGLRALSEDDIAAPGSGVSFGPGWYAVEQCFGRVFRWVGEEAEFTAEPPRPEGRVLSFEIEPGPGVGRQAFRLQVVEPAGNVLAEVRIEGRSVLRLQVSSPQGQAFRFRVIGGGLKIPEDPRVLNFRVFRCAWEPASVGAGQVSVAACGGKAPGWFSRLWSLRRIPGATCQFCWRAVRFYREWRRGSGPVRVGLPIPQEWLDRLDLRLEGGGVSIAVPSRPRKGGPEAPVHLHTNACGDFTLMAREHWFDVRGYPEFDAFSFNLDSMLCYAAHHAGAPEEVLAEPLRIYHIEHAAGSGWTPEGHAALFQRIADKGIPWVDFHELMKWALVMQRLQAPMIFNRENWGLADLDLRETAVQPGSRSARVAAQLSSEV